MKTLFGKLLFSFILIIGLILVSVLVSFYLVYSVSHEKEVFEENDKQALFISRSLQSFIGIAYKTVEGLAHDNDVLSMQTKLQTPVFESALTRNKYFELIYAQGMDGMQTGRSSGTLGNREERWWFKKMKQLKKPFVSDSYYSAATNMPCASIFYPIVKNSEMVGIMAGDINLAALRKMIIETATEGSWAYILDSEGFVVAHPDLSMQDEMYNFANLTKRVILKDSAGNPLINAEGVVSEEQRFYISDAYNAAIVDMMKGNSNSTKFKEDGKLLYLSYRPVELEGVSQPWYVLSVRDGAAAMHTRNTAILAIMASSAIIIVISVLCFAFLLISRQITKPLKQLTNDVSQIGLGNLDVRINISSNDELGLLAQTFNKMTANLKESIVAYAKEHAEKERIGAELNVATQIQASMLPCIFPAFPNREEFDIYATMLPAKEVGGDFYDFFLVNENTLCVVIADVSGKGVPAALFMVIAKTLIKNNAQYGKSPKEVFEIVNNLLCENNEAGMFVTAFMGYLDIMSGKFTFVNAGHNPPLLFSDGQFKYLKIKRGLVLAGMEDMFYEQDEIVLQKGDELFLYTDGVTEANNNEYALFGEQRLLETANKYADKPLKEFTISVKREIDKFVDGAQQADDITMLALRYGEL